MTESALKNLLIDRIKKIDDESLLQALKVLTDGKVEQHPYQLSDFEKEKISQGRQEDKYIDHQSAMQQIDEWLEK